jgi:hypothetical protein
VADEHGDFGEALGLYHLRLPPRFRIKRGEQRRFAGGEGFGVSARVPVDGGGPAGTTALYVVEGEARRVDHNVPE